MKKKSILFLVFLCSFSIQAQDIITMKNSEKINATIIERNNCRIKYQPVQNANSDTTLSMRLSKIKTIQYGNGSTDRLSSQNPRSIYPLGISGSYSSMFSWGWSSCLLFGSIDYLFTPNISAEISYGTWFDLIPQNIVIVGTIDRSFYSVGGKYWFANKYSNSGFSSFVSLQYDVNHFTNYWTISPGISYISKFGLQTSLELKLYNCTNDEDKSKFLVFEYKLGWRFRTGKKGN